MMKTNGYIYINSYILSEDCDKASFVFNIYIYTLSQIIPIGILFTYLFICLFIYLFMNDPFFFFFHSTFSWHFVMFPVVVFLVYMTSLWCLSLV